MNTEQHENYWETAARISERIAEYDEYPELIPVGEGVTMTTGFGGMSRPYTVIETRRNGKELVIQADTVRNITPGGAWQDNGEKEYIPNPKGSIKVITKRKSGRYVEKGEPAVHWQTRYRPGFRQDYTDYSQ